MISVIQTGQLPSEYRYRKTCTKCQTVFEFLQSDSTHVNSCDQRDAGLREITCPLTGCNETSLVTDRDRLIETPAIKAHALTYPPGVRSPFENRLFAVRGVQG